MNLPATTESGLAAEMHLARALANSSLIPVEYQGKPANVLVAMGYGRALGLEPMIAICGIHVVDGVPSLSAQLQNALVRRAGHRLWVEAGEGEVTAFLIRADDPTQYEHRAIWTMDMAKTAGLSGKDNWRRYPQAMLTARAITSVIRIGASDVLLGAAYTKEELDAGIPVGGDPEEIQLSPEGVERVPTPAA